MKDLTEQIYDELNAQVVRMLNHSLAQTSRIADLERQLSEASAPAVEQQPFGYFREMLNHEGKGNGVYLGVTEKKVSEQGHIPGETSETMIELYTAHQAAEADKVREAILALPLPAPTHLPYGLRYSGGDMHQLLELAADTAASMAAQAPVREVPEGWKLVPLEPTDAMWEAAHVAVRSAIGFHDEVYRAMIAAAPLPAAPAQQEGANNG